MHVIQVLSWLVFCLFLQTWLPSLPPDIHSPAKPILLLIPQHTRLLYGPMFGYILPPFAWNVHRQTTGDLLMMTQDFQGGLLLHYHSLCDNPAIPPCWLWSVYMPVYVRITYLSTYSSDVTSFWKILYISIALLIYFQRKYLSWCLFACLFTTLKAS